ncbi:hypothetical protein RM530_16550 [Algiphilus sp. W345]|uniref:Uncharacterized protein n=1 Tax=Banduia mediterranea TaxID=3075609 RepID=A0ABU2WN34_9GAMM|nr:hypothetical protein [Algiphilus sp. W345]MDT0498955.1 hypothetical protein [Algiphilus sp. W345]
MLLIAASLALLFLVALGVSQRFRASVARHRLGVAVVLFGTAGAIVFAFVASDYFSIDACLDDGGRWNKEREVCEYQEPSSAP